MSIRYSKPLREYRKPKFEIGDRVRTSNCDLPFRKGYRPQFTQEVLEKIAFPSKKPPTYTIKFEQYEIIRGKFYRQNWSKHLTMERFTVGMVPNASAQLFTENTLSSFTNFLPEQLKVEVQWEDAISEKSYSSMYQNVTEGEFLLWKATFKLPELFYLEPGLYPTIADIVGAMNTLIQEKHNHSDYCITI